MTSRSNPPGHLDLSSRQYDYSRSGRASPGDLPSPRSGDVPPALSPLDAFALQGRLLAQRLEAGNGTGRRMSRLPPLTIANALAQPRPGYFGPSSPSAPKHDNKPSPNPAGTEPLGISPHVAKPQTRPKSQYPLIQAFDDAESIYSRDSSVPTIKPVQEEEEEGDLEDTASKHSASTDYFQSAPTARSASPDTLPGQEERTPPSQQSTETKKQGSGDSYHSAHTYNVNRLALPQSPPRSRSPRFPEHKPSIRPVRVNSNEEADTLSINSDRFLMERQPSIGSQYSRPRSPYSPMFPPPHSPSLSSEFSQQPRASINFSRPLSRTGGRRSFETQRSVDDSGRSLHVESPQLRPSLDVLSLQESLMDSPRLPSIPWIDASTPLSLTDDEESPRPGSSSESRSYTYAKYALPRGRSLSKHSTVQANGRVEGPSSYQDEASHSFESNRDPLGNRTFSDAESTSSDTHMTSTIPAFPPLVRTASANDSVATEKTIRAHRSNPSFPPPSASVASGSSSRTLRPSHNAIFSSSADSRPSNASPLINTTLSEAHASASSPADPKVLADTLAQLTPEGHLAKGIACHENGELPKSTYHLRLAAKGGNPTGMFMYALACRHGWGIRPNQEEGVTWLRKAIDGAGLIVAEDEPPTAGESEAEAARRQRGSAIIAAKTHRAQLAVAIYELGTSYMNGWGIKPDKTQALRCYELAGTWGDGDALAEAGFCYAKGQGCKKDLKKAAEFYRKAADKGVSMAGNSW